jgi:Ca-activated chloride channel family protein
MYQKALEASKNNRFKADIQYDTGNVWFKQGDYQKALEAYKQVLELNPKHLQAKQNKELLEKLIVKPPPQQQHQDQKNKENEEEEQNQQQQQSQDQEQNQQEEEQKPQQDEQQPQEQEQQTSEKPESPEDKEKQLSKEEALRILDALEEKEKLQQQQRKLPPRPVEKDW